MGNIIIYFINIEKTQKFKQLCWTVLKNKIEKYKESTETETYSDKRKET